MAGLINDLMDKLGVMAEQVEALTKLAHEKKDVILNNDIDGLKDITARENAFVGRYQKTEKAVGNIMVDIALVLNQKASELTLGRLGELIIEQEDYGEYMKAYTRLKEGIDGLKERNDMNSVLIENALEYISYTVNAVRTSYGGDGDAVVDTRN